MTSTEFFTRARERIAAGRALMDAAQEMMRVGNRTAAHDLLDRAKFQQDAMLREMREANDADGK